MEMRKRKSVKFEKQVVDKGRVQKKPKTESIRPTRNRKKLGTYGSVSVWVFRFLRIPEGTLDQKRHNNCNYK